MLASTLGLGCPFARNTELPCLLCQQKFLILFGNLRGGKNSLRVEQIYVGAIQVKDAVVAPLPSFPKALSANPVSHRNTSQGGFVTLFK